MPFDAGSIVARLELNTKGWHAEIARVQKDQASLSGLVLKNEQKIKGFGKSLSIAGAAVTGTFGALIKKTADAGDELNDLSQRTGIATEILSGHKLALDKSGSSLSDFATGMKGLATQMDAANTGSDAAAGLFDTLGVSFAGADGKLRPLNDVMLDVADRLSKMPDGAQKTALAVDAFGRSGMNLIPFLNEGRQGLQDNYDITKKLGGLWSTQAAQAADAFNDSVSELKTATGGVAKEIGTALLPAIQDLINFARDVAEKVGTWAKEHPALAKGLGETALALSGLAMFTGPILLALPGLIRGFTALRLLASKSFTFTFSLAGVAIVAAGVKKMIDDFKELREEGKTTAEAIRDMIPNLNPFKNLSREHMRETLEGLDAARDKAFSLKGVGILLGDAWKFVKDQFEQSGKMANDKLNPALNDSTRKAEASRRAIEGILPPARDLNDLWARMHATMVTQTIPAARDLTGVLEGAGVAISKLPEAAEPAVTETSNMFDGLMNDIAQGFGNTIQEWLSGATTFRDFMLSLWGDIKNAIFTAIGKEVTEKLIGFFDSIIHKTKGVGDSIKENIGNALGNAGSTAGSMAGSFLSAASSIANIVTGVASVINLFKKSPTGAGDGMGRVVERQDQQTAHIKSILDFCRNDISKALLQYGVDYMAKTMDNTARTVEWLSEINGTLSGMRGAYNGAGPLTSPQMVMTHGTPSRPEYVVPEPMMRGGVGGGNGPGQPINLTVPVYVGGKKIDERIIQVVVNGSQTGGLRRFATKALAGAY